MELEARGRRGMFTGFNLRAKAHGLPSQKPQSFRNETLRYKNAVDGPVLNRMAVGHDSESRAGAASSAPTEAQENE